MSVRSILSIVLFKFTVSLLIFCLNDLSIVESRLLKSPVIVALLSVCSFHSVNICLMWSTCLSVHILLIALITVAFWYQNISGVIEWVPKCLFHFSFSRHKWRMGMNCYNSQVFHLGLGCSLSAIF
jgi:hypothetical protein